MPKASVGNQDNYKSRAAPLRVYPVEIQQGGRHGLY